MSTVITSFPVISNLYSHASMIFPIPYYAMLAAIAILVVLPTLASSSGEGNIRLLEDEVATAVRACTYNESAFPKRNNRNNRRRRSDDYHSQYQTQYSNQVPRLDDERKQHENMNPYEERRNLADQMFLLNGTDNGIPGYMKTNTSFKYVGTAITPSEYPSNESIDWIRNKRSDSLIDKSDQDQCLSQCVFANLQVVDGRGIPREAELWNKVQTAVTSQQSRTVLKDQIHACFQELQTEAEDNGCSYSNKLERCLMLRFSDRKLDKKT